MNLKDVRFIPYYSIHDNGEGSTLIGVVAEHIESGIRARAFEYGDKNKEKALATLRCRLIKEGIIKE